MLRIYDDWMSVMPELGRAFAAIGRVDGNLANQGRRTASSVALNIAEGFGCQDGNKRVRYETALGAAQETRAVLEVAASWGYLPPMSEGRRRWFNGICKALGKLSAKQK